MQQKRSKSENIADLLDSRYRIPGTDIRFGIDPLLGLLPGIGDWLGAILSAYLMVLATRMGAGLSVLSRMFLNIMIDLLFGAVPVLGDLFDFGWRANERNARLLNELEEEPEELAFRSRILMWGMLILFILIILGGLYLTWWMAEEIVTAVL
ncbi:MAG: DUF4112 domain-containing protein [Balneolaceae bacterium]|nr:DUF4112 domain-containing protein [Balneolaceae bacterium]